MFLATSINPAQIWNYNTMIKTSAPKTNLALGAQSWLLCIFNGVHFKSSAMHMHYKKNTLVLRYLFKNRIFRPHCSANLNSALDSSASHLTSPFISSTWFHHQCMISDCTTEHQDFLAHDVDGLFCVMLPPSCDYSLGITTAQYCQCRERTERAINCS